jgi:hypothetical protein
MQTGYSLLLLEHVSATEVDYGDCEEFQITCPACHEAIFKAGRHGGDRQYFSHYAASKSDVRECELRVAAMNQEQMAADNLIKRGQTIEKFFDRFRMPVLEWLYKEDAPTVRKQVAWGSARPSFLLFAHDIRDHIANTDVSDIQHYKEALTDDRKTVFWIKRQNQYATGFLNHLVAPNSFSAFAFILLVSLIYFEKFAEKQQTTLLNGKDKELRKVFASLTDADYHNCFCGVYALIHAIPYLKFLGSGDHKEEESYRKSLNSLNALMEAHTANNPGPRREIRMKSAR